MDEQKEGENREILEEAPPEHYFWVHNGQKVRNLSQLKDSVETMSDETFQYHANEQKNDFSNWVRDIIGDEELAKGIAEARERRKIIELLEDRLKKEEKPKRLASVRKVTESLKNFVPKKKEDEQKKELGIKEIDSKVEEILKKEDEIEKKEDKIQEEIEDVEIIEEEIIKQRRKTVIFSIIIFLLGIVTGIAISILMILIMR